MLNRNIFKSENIISCDQVCNYSVLTLYKSTTPVKSKEWKPGFCLKSFSGGQTASTLKSHLSKWGTVKFRKLDVIRERLDAPHELFTWDFSYVWYQRPKFFLPVSSTIIHLGGWSLKWPPGKPLPCWGSHKCPLSDNTSTGLCWNPVPQSSRTSAGQTQVCITKQHEGQHSLHHSQHAGWIMSTSWAAKAPLVLAVILLHLTHNLTHVKYYMHPLPSCFGNTALQKVVVVY